MAGDWIKMRIDLQSHPKVVRILSATRADKFRVIGGLHAVWTIFDTHSVDGVLPGYTPEVLDHIISWDGFAKAMIDVNWLIFDDQQTLTMPGFEEHNGKGGKRRAEDQKRKRDTRNSPESVRASIRNQSENNADILRTESGLEKRREEKKEQKQPKAAVTVKIDLPDWVDAAAWAGFAEMRRRERHPLTDRATKLVIGELIKLREVGHDPSAVLDQSTRNGWRDVYPIKSEGGGQKSAAKIPDHLVGAI